MMIVVVVDVGLREASEVGFGEPDYHMRVSARCKKQAQNPYN